ncbi:MAG: SagB/ThcOx family dehydrogenase [Bacteroidales bacterium]
MKTHTLNNQMQSNLLIVCIIFLLFPNTKSFSMLPGKSPQDNNIIQLPAPQLSSGVSVEEAMLNRRSIREFKDIALSLEEVSQVLWSAYGITEERSQPAFLRGGLRTAPSAGALYPLDIYLAIGNVKGLKAGIYKYISEMHAIELISEGDVRKDLAKAALDQEFLEQAPVSLVFVAVYSRTTQKYGERGRERYVCMDLGHSAQNVYLQTTAMNLGTCAVGAFTDRMVSMSMLLKSEEEPLYIMPIGKY